MKYSIKSLLSRIAYSRSNNRIEQFSGLQLGATIGNCIFLGNVLVSKGASISSSVIKHLSPIGRNTKIVHTNIGKYCAVSWDCTINAIGHPLTNPTISAFPYAPHVGNFVPSRTQIYDKVEIGNDVWIGAHAIIMPGIEIGDGAVIGAGSIVTKDVKPYEIVAGNPAKHIKYRFNQEFVQELLEIKWWEWEDSTIRKNIHLFQKKLDKEILAELSEVGRG